MHFFTFWDSQKCIAPVLGLATRVHLDFHRMAGALGRKIHGALTGKGFSIAFPKTEILREGFISYIYIYGRAASAISFPSVVTTPR